MRPEPLLRLSAIWLSTALKVHARPQSLSTTTGTSPREIFTVPASADVGLPLIPTVQDSQAVDPQTCPGYVASDVVTTKTGLVARLSLAGQACNVYGQDVESLTLTVEYQAQDRLHVEIIPAFLGRENITYYFIPDGLVRKPAIDADPPSPDASDLQFTWTNEPTFSWTVRRRSSGDVLFSTKGRKLVFEDQFIEFGSDLPPNYHLYGLGEVIHGLRLGNNLTRTLYNADAADPVDQNLYGSHPFYLETRYFTTNEGGTNKTTSTSHGVYLRNAHGQEVLLKEKGITWRTIGGVIDLYFFAGPTALEVTRRYQKDAIGLPAMQQYFTLGYHQCRWGYHNWTELQAVVDGHARFGIPLETIWTDIDYMNQYRDFDNDQRTFPYDEGQQFLQRLHDSGRHYVPIVDSAIYVPNPENASDAYPVFDAGNNSNSFLRNIDGSLMIGDVWPGYTAFPDWLSSGAGPWWTESMTTWHGKISFDGIWIDMSEVSSFCVGSCGSKNLSVNPVHPPFALPGEPGNIIYDYPEGFNLTNGTEAATAISLSSSQAVAVAAASSTAASGASSTSTVPIRTRPTPGVRNVTAPPYTLNNVQGGDLAVHAVSPAAVHNDARKTQEYEIHNLFGHGILNATYNALLAVSPGKRPFIIGRSTFAGSGVFAGHWGGDNYSLWASMFFSIPQALSFSLFGIPFFGVDTCGFNGNSDYELCSRWSQLSAFFPFYRNHNTLSAIPQEFYTWSSVIDAAKVAMAIRYAMLPYMYTLLYDAHTSGSTVMRALAWEFPDDLTLAAVDRQFLLGPSVLVTPVLTPGATSVQGVFPGSSGQGQVIWYDWYTSMAMVVNDDDVDDNNNVTIDAPLGHIPVFVRGGSILPLHCMPMNQPVLTTRDARRTPWRILIALTHAGTATGHLYLDDGQSVHPADTLFVQFDLAHNQLNVSVTASSHISSRRLNSTPLDSITIWGLPANSSSSSFSSSSSSYSPSTVSFNHRLLPSSSWSYNSTSTVLTIVDLVDRTRLGTFISNWSLTWT